MRFNFEHELAQFAESLWYRQARAQHPAPLAKQLPVGHCQWQCHWQAGS